MYFLNRWAGSLDKDLGLYALHFPAFKTTRKRHCLAFTIHRAAIKAGVADRGDTCSLPSCPSNALLLRHLPFSNHMSSFSSLSLLLLYIPTLWGSPGSAYLSCLLLPMCSPCRCPWFRGAWAGRTGDRHGRRQTCRPGLTCMLKPAATCTHLYVGRRTTTDTPLPFLLYCVYSVQADHGV